MLNRALNNADNFNTLSQWLNENLNDKKSIKAYCQELIKVSKVMNSIFTLSV